MYQFIYLASTHSPFRQLPFQAMLSMHTLDCLLQHLGERNSAAQAVPASGRETAAAEHQGGIRKFPAYRQPVAVVPAKSFLSTPTAGKEEKTLVIGADDGKAAVFRIFADNIIERLRCPHPSSACLQVYPAAAGTAIPACSGEQDFASGDSQPTIPDDAGEGKFIQPCECGI